MRSAFLLLCSLGILDAALLRGSRELLLSDDVKAARESLDSVLASFTKTLEEQGDNHHLALTNCALANTLEAPELACSAATTAALAAVAGAQSDDDGDDAGLSSIIMAARACREKDAASCTGECAPAPAVATTTTDGVATCLLSGDAALKLMGLERAGAPSKQRALSGVETGSTNGSALADALGDCE